MALNGSNPSLQPKPRWGRRCESEILIIVIDMSQLICTQCAAEAEMVEEVQQLWRSYVANLLNAKDRAIRVGLRRVGF